MRLKIRFDIIFADGTAKDRAAAIANTVRGVADKVERETVIGETSGMVRDANGNRIGKWSIK